MLPYAVLKLTTKRNDSSVLCQLHYLYMRNFFLFSCILSVTRQYFGDTIICHKQRGGIEDNLLDTQCLINGTFTVREDRSIVYHDYYQWVPLFLIIQALVFHLPYHLWTRTWNRSILNAPAEVCAEEIRRSGQKAFKSLVVLEVTCMINLLVQTILVERVFLGGYSEEDLFPLNSNCTFDYYDGGMPTTGRFLCLLPLNVLYRKVFLVGTLAFGFLFLLHCVFLPYRIAQCCFKRLRGDGPFVDDLDRWWLYNIMIENIKEPWKLKSLSLKHGETITKSGTLSQLELRSLKLEEGKTRLWTAKS